MEDINYPTVDKLEIQKPRKKPSWILVIILALAVLGLAGVLYSVMANPKVVEKVVVEEVGPCFKGAKSTVEAGFKVYENAALGYKFAYPEAWGEVKVATTPVAKETGKYVQGSFATNKDVTFGGNAIDYTVGARGGMATDLPGYLQAKDKFYTVELWKVSAGDKVTVKNSLLPIAEKVTLKDGCNARAAVTTVPKSALNKSEYDQARFNLLAGNEYYGVNFVLKNATPTSRVDFDKVLSSFQTLSE